MPAIALLLGLLLGSATPVAIGSVTALQWAELALKVGPKGIALLTKIKGFVETPQFREWAARNGQVAISLQPGIKTER